MAILNEIAAGGQTWAHRVRMLRQVFKIVLIASLISSFLFFSVSLVKKMSSKDVYAVWYSLKALTLKQFNKEVEVDSNIWKSLSGKDHLRALDPDEALLTLKKTHLRQLALLKRLAKQSLVSFILFSGLFLVFFLTRGQKSKKKKHLSGIKTLSDLELATKLRFSLKASPLKMGRIPLLKDSETSHMLICGATRSGKTNSLYQLLKQIRKRGDRAIIIDSTNIFTSAFYDEQKDILFNPYDSRFPGWHPWVECEEEYHYEQIVNSLIPSMEYFDNFFPEAARAVLYSALRKRGAAGDRSIENFVNSLLRQSIQELYEELKDTDASIYVDPRGDKTTVSVRATISNSLRYFRPLRDCKDPFSIRKWILSKENRSQWLFLSSTTDQRERLKNLMGMWFSLASNALMSKEPLNNKPEKIWFIADELHSLGKLEYLPKSLAEFGKYGGCIILATQNISQIEEVYGAKVAESITDQCGTKICFRQQSARLAEKMSDLFGKEEIKEVQEGLSYGAHQMRDGVSLSNHEKIRPTVSPTKILSLDNLEAYVKLPGSIAAAKTKFKYEKIIPKTEGFINLSKREG